MILFGAGSWMSAGNPGPRTYNREKECAQWSKHWARTPVENHCTGEWSARVPKFMRFTPATFALTQHLGATGNTITTIPSTEIFDKMCGCELRVHLFTSYFVFGFRLKPLGEPGGFFETMTWNYSSDGLAPVEIEEGDYLVDFEVEGIHHFRAILGRRRIKPQEG